MPHNFIRQIYKALLLTALIALSTTTFAQRDSDEYSAFSDDPTSAFVLALSGLRLREFPGTASKVLTIIPFASKVTLMRDPTLARNEDDGYLFDADSIRGNWVNVQYQGKTGYVFDAYLGNKINKMNKASYLIMPDAAGCRSDAYASKAYHYYGVYLDKSKQQASLKTIKPVFHADHDEFESISMRAPGKERPYFMLATREPLAEDGPVNKHHFFSKLDDYERDDKNQFLRNDTILKAIRIPESNWELSCVKQKEEDSNPPYYRKVVQLKDRITGQK